MSLFHVRRRDFIVNCFRRFNSGISSWRSLAGHKQQSDSCTWRRTGIGEDRTPGIRSAVSCYSSINLLDWKREGVALWQTNLPSVTAQPIPKTDRPARSETRCKFHRQWTMAGAGHILAQVLFVRREDANTASSPRNRHIPLGSVNL